MKRKIQRLVISLFVLGLVATLFAATEEYDYGKVRWGMTITEVVRSIGRGGELIFSDQLGGDFTLTVGVRYSIYRAEDYLFDEKTGQLSAVVGKLDEDATSEEVFLFLSEKYGKPIATNTVSSETTIVFVRRKTKVTFDLDDNGFPKKHVFYFKYDK